jgi:hypothetical protein
MTPSAVRFVEKGLIKMDVNEADKQKFIRLEHEAAFQT